MPAEPALYVAVAELHLEEARAKEEAAREAWYEARKLLAKAEQELSRLQGVVVAERRGELPVERVRSVIMRFRGGFTATELAAELNVDVAKVRKRLKEEVDRGSIRQAGRFSGKPIYEWVPPEGPGASFEAQQRLRSVEEESPRVEAQPVAGSGETLAGIAKELQPRVREALADGWRLERTGSDHYRLVRRGKKVGFAGTPRNPGNEAQYLRQRLRRAESVG